ncbi:SAM domain (Sterile alpha motif) domain-containing protein [Ditylenchus destructor]|uniref:SAM domain (Sterile alpha motif) domain-containing protein n=1 Tax=Ditylenchus destructor TaxID=166010 RepID=A0AAD4N1Y2_9BILA|nr:SAM domain (Sterile alpha motif) domain-containing protein [Ditylenchus destructor]
MFQSRLIKLQGTNILPTEVIYDVVQFMTVENMKRLKRTSSVLHVHISRRLQQIKSSTENARAACPAKWTCKEVSDYFTSEGYQALAKKFLDQGYDGEAIMLLKREDLTWLGIKRGETLKVLALIDCLKQNLRNEHPPITGNPAKWNYQEVLEWFKGAGYPELAEKLFDRGFGGKAIMLLKQKDLTSFGLKQGTRLEVHALIEVLKKTSERMTE